jgi:hypothetical protein
MAKRAQSSPKRELAGRGSKQYGRRNILTLPHLASTWQREPSPVRNVSWQAEAASSIIHISISYKPYSPNSMSANNGRNHKAIITRISNKLVLVPKGIDVQCAFSHGNDGQESAQPRLYTHSMSCSFDLSATRQQYFSLGTNQHQASVTRQTNMLSASREMSRIPSPKVAKRALHASPSHAICFLATFAYNDHAAPLGIAICRWGRQVTSDTGTANPRWTSVQWHLGRYALTGSQ